MLVVWPIYLFFIQVHIVRRRRNTDFVARTWRVAAILY